MDVDVIKVGLDEEIKVGRARVTRTTNMKELFQILGKKHFGEHAKFNVRRDQNVFGWVAVDSDGYVLEVR